MAITQKRRTGATGLRHKLGLTQRCPPGEVLRAPYRRRFSSSVVKSGYNVHRKNKTYRIYPKPRTTTVKAVCIKDRGLPGKGPRSGTGIGTLKKGDLSRYGYNYHKDVKERHEALLKAMSVYGPLTVYHKLDAIVKYTVRTAPKAHMIFKHDRDWVYKNFPMKKRV
jgi:hypothetical protein